MSINFIKYFIFSSLLSLWEKQGGSQKTRNGTITVDLGMIHKFLYNQVLRPVYGHLLNLWFPTVKVKVQESTMVQSETYNQKLLSLDTIS